MFDRFSACLRVWISQGSEQPSILNIWLVLNVPKFWIYQGSNYAPSFEYARVTPCSEYAWIIHEHVWICLNMSGYVWIYLRVPEFKIGGHESWYTLLVFCFLKTCKKSLKSYPIFVKLLTFNRSGHSCIKSLLIICQY